MLGFNLIQNIKGDTMTITRIKHILHEKGIAALEEAKKINKPLYYNASGGCGVTYGLRMFSVYQHGPFDWVLSRITSDWSPEIMLVDLLEKKFEVASKPTHHKTLSQNCYFIHENLFDEKVRAKLIRRSENLIKALKSDNPPIPVRMNQPDNVELMDCLWADDVEKFKKVFISKLKKYQVPGILSELYKDK